MIVYTATKQKFRSDIFENSIEEKIQELLYSKTNKRASQSEVRSWKNSLQYMDRVIDDPEIPMDSSIAIEYGIPQTSKRIDFIIAGRNARAKGCAVIVELKQWETAKATTMDAIVETYLGGTTRNVEHPSYQAWTYAALLEDYNENLHEKQILLQPCAFLHNCSTGSGIKSPFYNEHIERAPLFFKEDTAKLRFFIKQFVKYGDKNSDVLYRIENGKIKPSKKLADALVSMLKGNKEFRMIDEQKVIYETIMRTVIQNAKKAGTKEVIIVEGGPGTGKSVLAVNLLVDITARELLTQYVSKNSAPREVYASKLTGSMKKTHINNLFKGSGIYHEIKPDQFDALIVDEAHRLNEKSGMFSNKGENQVKEIIAAGKTSIFFVDDDQIVTFKDIGRKSEIIRWAENAHATISHFQLTSQFRCNGSSAYPAWLNHVLDIKASANFNLDQEMFDFRVLDNPCELRDLIEKKNLEANSSRIVAGYCWDWISKNTPDEYDIVIPEHNFKMRWNLEDDGMLWILKENSVKEAGCIHTCQGLEVDYIGVIIGEDFIVRDGIVKTQPEKRAGTDKSIHGYKKLTATDPEEAQEKTDLIIKNTYKTLMTRGLKGCYIYCVDKETREYFKNFLNNKKESTLDTEDGELPFTVIPFENVIPYKNAIPAFKWSAAAGEFSDYQNADDVDWVELPEPWVAKPGYFICRVVGNSMNKKIPNGSWCLFREDIGGTRDGKIVLVKHRDIQDPDYGGCYTVKYYHSDKMYSEDSWEHTKIILKPYSFFAHYQNIVLYGDNVADLKVIGIFVAVIG
jgi:DUF2075 family protein